MLNLFAANIHAKLGGIGKAKMLIGNALKENPYIVSAWVDLGEFYFLDFDPTGAWFSWDIARRLHPDHHLLVKTSTLEQRLEKNIFTSSSYRSEQSRGQFATILSGN